MKLNRLSGFTLVELLVVIAIIGVLIALLLPAVQQAREAARRMQCKNHLKQYGVALHNYHDVHGSLASGMMAHANGGWSWGTLLLPFIEQGNIHDQINFNLPPDNGANSNAILNVVSIALCPSDLAPETNDDPSLAPQATTSYLASAGSNMFIPSRCSGGDEGSFFHNSDRKFRDFSDGLTNSILVGEVAWRIGAYSSGSPVRNTQHYYGGLVTGKWFSFGDPCGTGTGTDDTDYRRTYAVMRHAGVSINHYHAGGDTWWDEGHHAFGSNHPGGAHFLFGDGSVHFLSEHIESNTGQNWWPDVTAAGFTPGQFTATYQKLHSINDGNVVTIP